MKLLAAALILLLSTTANAQEGYEIKLTLKPFKNQYVYLGHYNGKQLPVVDSAMLNEKSEAVFRGNRKLGGGIYLIGFPDRSRTFDFLIDKNQKFAIVADTAHLDKITYINSAENISFKDYQDQMNAKGKELDALVKQRSSAKTKEDSTRVNKQIEALNLWIRNYRTELMDKQPESLLAALLRAMREPEVPHDDPAAKTDSLFGYKYFKSHYWDGVYFFDDRLVRTPFFEPRIDKYFEQLVFPSADSVIKEIDWMLGYASASEEMQKFLLVKFVNRYMTQRYMWEDAVFVHLFEKYFSNKTYPWLSEKGKKMITDRAYNLMANIMGNPAPEIDLPDSAGRKTTLYSLQAPYTVVVIWDPTCGHCKETLPKLDSLYRNKWRSSGMKIYALAKETEGKRSDWTTFIKQHGLQNWVNVYYSKEAEQARISANIPGYSQLYDVQSFPTLYLLDKDKRIIAKKLSFEQIDEILEQRKKTNKNP